MAFSVIFTSNDDFMSNLIKWTTQEPISHVALRIGDDVIHSIASGLKKQSYASFCQEYNIFDEIQMERVIINIPKYSPEYDMGAFLFLGLCLILRRYLKIPLPKSNLWQVTGMYLCSEFVSKMIFDQERSMLTPGGLYKLLGGKKHF